MPKCNNIFISCSQNMSLLNFACFTFDTICSLFSCLSYAFVTELFWTMSWTTPVSIVSICFPANLTCFHTVYSLTSFFYRLFSYIIKILLILKAVSLYFIHEIRRKSWMKRNELDIGNVVVHLFWYSWCHFWERHCAWTGHYCVQHTYLNIM